MSCILSFSLWVYTIDFYGIFSFVWSNFKEIFLFEYLISLTTLINGSYGYHMLHIDFVTHFALILAASGATKISQNQLLPKFI